MAEYIEREAALESVREKVLICESLPDTIAKDASLFTLASMNDSLNSIPAADVRPVRRGKWVDNKVAFYLGCSECGCYLEYAVDTFLDCCDHYNFCPNCGADMREES